MDGVGRRGDLRFTARTTEGEQEMAKASKKAGPARPRTSGKHAAEMMNSSSLEERSREERQDLAAAGDRRPVPNHEPTDEEVARRAYEIYVSRGQEPGRHVEDWLQARRELEAAGAHGRTA
jgi:Protein of unknown function (DUF2934)